jgi:replicative DNA helicase
VSDQLPPQNLDAEESLLGAILVSPAMLDAVADIVRPDDFYRASHGRIFSAAVALAHRDGGHGAIAVADELEKRGELEAAGGKLRLFELEKILPASGNAPHWARIIRDEAIKRELQAVGRRLAALDLDTPEAPEMLAAAEQHVYDLARKRETRKARAFPDIVHDAVLEIQARQESAGKLLGLTTSITGLDEVTHGLRPGALYVVAATTGKGKSALATGIACNLVLARPPTKVAFFSLEMGEQEIVDRLLCRTGRLPHDALVTGRLDAEQFGRIVAAAADLRDAPLHLEAHPTLTPTQLLSRLRRLDGLGLVVVDYLQLVTPDRANEKRAQEVAEVARMLKQAAMTLQVPVLALAQLNRDVDRRPGGKPQLADLKESGEIEQAADVVVFIWNGHDPEDGVRELLVAKNRHGRADVGIRVSWIGDRMRFGDLQHRVPGDLGQAAA